MSVSYLSHIGEARRSSIAVVILTVIAVAILAVSPSASATAICGPFGDPPQTLISNPIPNCLGGTLLGPWNDSDGTPRYACLYQPSSATTSSPLPLLVWLHPSLVTADSIISTNILSFQNDFSLAPGTKGFAVLTPEGRSTTHFYPAPDNQGPGWDNWYRQFAPGPVTVNGVSYPENVDAATIDRFVGVVQSSETVLIDKTFVSGWSNGSAMSYIYALNRPSVNSISSLFGARSLQRLQRSIHETPVEDTPSTMAEIAVPRIPRPRATRSTIHATSRVYARIAR